MIGEKQAKVILDKALGYSRADQTEALLIGGDSHLTRFANSAIHQNVAERNNTLHLRVVVGRRIGQASTNDLSDAGISRTMTTALEIAKHQTENPDFVSLPGPLPIQAIGSYFSSTADCTPEERARAVEVICRRSVETGMAAAGAFSTDTEEIAIANSLGIRAYHIQTVAELSTVVMSEDSSGYSYRVALDVTDIDPEDVAAEAVGKASRGRHPAALGADYYEVILEPYATQDILAYLGYVGLSAQAVKEQRSFMGGHLGERLVGSNVSLYDDGLQLDGLPMPFDFEGVPKRHVDFFARGIAQDVVWDSYLASQEGRQSTGHALPSPIISGPLPANMFMQAGSASQEELIRGVKRGLWITRFWYTRPVEPMQVIVTGMTRDGTFLIENGEIVGPVKNLRFTQSYLEALNNVEAISADTQLIRDNGLAFRVPTLKVGKWHFVSATDY